MQNIESFLKMGACDTWNFEIHAFFYKQHFYKQHLKEIGKKSKQKLSNTWGWTFGEHVEIRSLSVSIRLCDQL